MAACVLITGGAGLARSHPPDELLACGHLVRGDQVDAPRGARARERAHLYRPARFDGFSELQVLRFRPLAAPERSCARA